MQFILNGSAHGNVAATLMSNDFNPRALRPYVETVDGIDRTFIDVVRNGKEEAILTNAPGTLRKDEWKILDDAVIKAAKPRLKAVADLRGAGLQYTIANGMAKTVLEYEDQSDITEATVSMDGLRRSASDRPVYDLKGLPLPIVHKDLTYSARQVMTSRNGNTPLDTTGAELAGRRVAEEVEKMLLGTASTYAFGGYNVYGFTNFPSRLTKSLTAPTSSNHATTVKEVLEMQSQSVAAFHYGPWMLYYSPAWREFMGEDYSTAKGDNTLRQRLADLDDIVDVRGLDYLPDTTLLLVQQSVDVARMVVGMEITTVQWETQGGMELNYKVMGILVPHLRADQNGNTGIVHGSV